MYRASMVADKAARGGFAIGCTGVLVPPMGVNAEPLSALVLISAAEIPAARIRVYREDRAERWFNDQVERSELGEVTIGG